MALDQRLSGKDAEARDRDGADLKARDLTFLQQHFGKSGPYFYWITRGIDERQVKPDRIRKSVGAEDTFREDIHDLRDRPRGPAAGGR